MKLKFFLSNSKKAILKIHYSLQALIIKLHMYAIIYRKNHKCFIRSLAMLE